MATEWIRRTSGSTCLDLAALEVADEVPGERVAPPLALRLEVLQAVLADERRPRPPRAPPSRRAGTYLVAARISTPGPARSRTRSRLARMTPASSPRISPGIAHPSPLQTSPAWRPVRPPSRRCEKNSSGLQLVQSSRLVDRADPGVARAGAARPRAGRASSPSRPRRRARRRRPAPRRRPRSSTARSRGRSPPPRRRPRQPRARRSRPPARASRRGSSPPRPARRARSAGSRRR